MNTQNQKTYTFHVVGMHCNSCVLLTESELNDHALVERAVADLKTCCVEVTGDFKDKNSEEVARELSPLLEKHGYTLALEKQNEGAGKWSQFKIAIPIAIGFAILFVALQKMGLVNLVHTSTLSLGTVFVVGIIASLSTCMAVVGGLVLSLSATYSKEGDKIKPQLMFHGGRLIAFFVLGGVIGAIGAAFTLSSTATFILSVLIGLVMLIMGINLLGIFHFAKRLQPGMPKFISKHALGVTRFNHSFAPMLVGVATFFLPCGFTQAMQIYTLGTGTFLKGGLTMVSFALGTLPVLALISFSSLKIKKRETSEIFFKSAGLIVILFAFFNLINSLVVIGVLPPIFNF